MKKLTIAILATVFISAPLFAQTQAFAQTRDWWLVSGEPGDTVVQFIDAASVEKTDFSVSFDVATYWSNGRSMERELTMKCNEKPVANAYVDLWKFACGSDEIRMSSALKLGSTKPDWLAKTVFTMPS